MRASLTVLMTSCLALMACNSEPKPAPEAKPTAPASTVKTAKAETTKADSKAAPESKAVVEAQYTVRIMPGEAAAGAAASSVVEVKPTPGYKMNTEFPVQIKKLSAPDGVTLPKATLASSDAELTEKVLRFTVPFTAAKAGQIDLAGLADFSVCNERACKLIRDEKVAWQVTVK